MKDLFSIEGKVALVTGGSRGIGLMIARGFVEAGATRLHLVAQGRRRATHVAAELSKRRHLHRAAGRPLDRGGAPRSSPTRSPRASPRCTCW